MSAEPYHLAERGTSLGVFRPAEVEAGLATGRFAGTVLSWREGEAGWVPLASRPEFGAARSAFVTLQPVTSPAFEVGPRWVSPGFFRRWALTWFGVLFRPTATFRPFQEGGRIGRAWLWLLLAATLAVPALFFLGQAPLVFFLRSIGRTVELPTAGLNLTYLGRALFLLPLWATGLGAGLTLALHLSLRVFGGGVAGWRATFRVVAYLGGAGLLAGVGLFLGLSPLLPRTSAAGGFLSLAACVGALGFGGLLVRALALAHGDAGWKPALAMLAVLVLGCCAGGLCIAAALAPFFAPLGG
ncbi:MAG: hypothetical protein RLZZ405_801 [Verrucomicrobiota bacterium]|jgi:hypothetical protein